MGNRLSRTVYVALDQMHHLLSFAAPGQKIFLLKSPKTTLLFSLKNDMYLTSNACSISPDASFEPIFRICSQKLKIFINLVSTTYFMSSCGTKVKNFKILH